MPALILVAKAEPVRVFIFESTCGGGLLGKPDPAAELQAEGTAMLSAVAVDLARLPGVTARRGRSHGGAAGSGQSRVR